MMSANKPPTATAAMGGAAATPAGGSGGEQQTPQGFIPAPPVAPFAGGKSGRPASEIFFANAQHPLPEARHVDRWFESLTQFEDMLEDMAKVSLDTEFKNELDTIDEWYSVLAEPERTAALYSLMQHCSNSQVRFFITILQQMLAMDQDQDPDAGGNGMAGPDPARHSMAAHGAYAKHHSAQAAPVAFGAIRGPAATGIPMLGGPSAMQRAGGWSTNNMSSDNLLLMGSSSGAKPPASLVAGVGPLKPDVRRISGLGDPTLQQPLLQRPKSSNHEADANPDWRIHRPLQGSAVGSPTAEHFAHQQLAIGAVGASRRQSNNLLTQQQATPRVSIDMEPKDFRWSSLTDSLEPFGAIGSDSNPPGLPHMFEANINRTSGIAARRSVSSRLSIPVKSPRDTLQSQQLGASLAQMSVSGIAGGQHLSSPLAATFAPQQQQNLAMPRGHYAQAAAAAPGPSFPMQYHQGFGVGHPSGMGTATAAPMPMPPPQPSRTLYGHSEPSTTPPGGDAGLKGQSEVVDLSLIRDIPAWLRSLRLHKYTECFIGMDWTSVVSLSDEQLQAKGVAALGARRKMLKVFEAVLKDM